MIRFEKITFKLLLYPVFELILVISGFEQIVKSIYKVGLSYNVGHLSDIRAAVSAADLGLISIRSRFDFDAGFSRTQDQSELNMTKNISIKTGFYWFYWSTVIGFFPDRTGSPAIWSIRNF